VGEGGRVGALPPCSPCLHPIPHLPSGRAASSTPLASSPSLPPSHVNLPSFPPALLPLLVEDHCGYPAPGTPLLPHSQPPSCPHLLQHTPLPPPTTTANAVSTAPPGSSSPVCCVLVEGSKYSYLYGHVDKGATHGQQQVRLLGGGGILHSFNAKRGGLKPAAGSWQQCLLSWLADMMCCRAHNSSSSSSSSTQAVLHDGTDLIGLHAHTA